MFSLLVGRRLLVILAVLDDGQNMGIEWHREDLMLADVDSTSECISETFFIAMPSSLSNFESKE